MVRWFVAICFSARLIISVCWYMWPESWQEYANQASWCLQRDRMHAWEFLKTETIMYIHPFPVTSRLPVSLSSFKVHFHKTFNSFCGNRLKINASADRLVWLSLIYNFFYICFLKTLLKLLSNLTFLSFNPKIITTILQFPLKKVKKKKKNLEKVLAQCLDSWFPSKVLLKKWKSHCRYLCL